MKNLVTILFLLVATISVNAADIVVNGSGLPGTYNTISAAVQAASAGDKILVSNQHFRSTRHQMILKRKWVVESFPNTMCILENGTRYTYYENI